MKFAKLKKCRQLISVRSMQLYALLICIGMLVGAVYFQFALKLAPCPLCMVQRIIVVILGLAFFIGLCIRGTITFRISSFINFLIASFGCLVAGRHVYIQHLPQGQTPGCGPELEFMLKNFSLDQSFHLLIQGTADCADLQWVFLDITLAGWTLICFLVLALIALTNLVRT